MEPLGYGLRAPPATLKQPTRHRLQPRGQQPRTHHQRQLGRRLAVWQRRRPIGLGQWTIPSGRELTHQQQGQGP
eukprot:CAMPEP_0174379544 /NCGR_PEP_ID=MMETSP0811_2-20130205/122783_1 /TAXON_ID=73025 ORGANISM="Eutreptiella gymnastica-like, Strain CCMP1594" /NCGR_SAMPLE_ID=MMETSP0811_2 /ASSEMBLY_ACC=CAM_ASM_000667 /LENGTH=73 /DNA_ID=CAMNT_0015532119 /DNA_START=352 /DNA_END=573 /DNA_ORIENTATION=+